ncbi:DUF4345 domain-containing protein [Sphingobium algorifonticola]|uniref:DUF4345 domain-containing protein n=1 Tax=Sphingobium algorifonticola TaxID=2008318 RepID=A0A437JBD4_9SPHN|nr:DUF4345 domain-containing protein [Sphingobium algorifonticola]RVT43229.1 DUF4345 domain-containing protein [Sphingobium algorifonticola]
MTALTGEKRLLQAVVALACVVPVVTGGMGIIAGPGWLRGVDAAPADLDSHFRYMSGIFFGVGLAFCTCVPAIEAKGERFRMLGAFVVIGGLARLWSLIAVGTPSTGHLLGLGMELGVVPCLMLWQASFVRRFSASR